MLARGVLNSCDTIETKLVFNTLNSFSRSNDSTNSFVRTFTFISSFFVKSSFASAWGRLKVKF